MQKDLLDGSVLGQWPPNFLAPGISSVEDSFSMDWVRGVVTGYFECVTFNVHFISIIIISAPPQIIRHQIPNLEVGKPCSRVCERL